MKFFKGIICLCAIFLIVSCFDSNPVANENNQGTNENNQVVFMSCDYQTAYWDVINEETVQAPNAAVIGEISGDTIPMFNYCKANGIEKKKYELRVDRIRFGDLDYKNCTPILNNYDSIEVEVATSSGVLKANISLPEIPGDIIATPDDYLNLNESLTLSWSCENTDFYIVTLFFAIADSNNQGSYWGYAKDTIVTSNSVTFDKTYFGKKGYIDDIYIQGFNGPKPGIGATGNMSGKGTGYLYYRSLEKKYDGNAIIIAGRGKENCEKVKFQNDDEKLKINISKRGSDKIKKMLGL